MVNFMEDINLVMKESSSIANKELIDFEEKSKSIDNLRREFQANIEKLNEDIESKKSNVIKKEKEVISKIRVHLGSLALKRYYKKNREVVDEVVEKLENGSIKIGEGINELLEIEEKLSGFVREQEETDKEEIEELEILFPEEEIPILMNYINSNRFKSTFLE